MSDPLEGIEKQIRRRNFDSPPLHLWDPPLSGDIAIRIAADGCWYHEGTPLRREALVRLFASILRREDDGHYYLVTPVEKWRIEVELHPLIVTDITQVDIAEGEQPLLQASLNTGKTVLINEEHPLFLEPAVGNIPALELTHGLTALLSRATWYRLADMAGEKSGVLSISSGDYRFELGQPD
jgi:hypothetical protein